MKSKTAIGSRSLLAALTFNHGVIENIILDATARKRLNSDKSSTVSDW
jgi:hypothetical protein